MAKSHAQSAEQPDVLVLGEHPCAYFAAALLREGTHPLRVMHAGIPGESHPDRLVLINPEFFDLHAMLGSLKRKLELTGLYGTRFLGASSGVASEYTSKSITAYVASFKQIQEAAIKLAEAHEVIRPKDSTLEIHGVDETGIDVTVGRTRCKPKLLLLAGLLPSKRRRILGIPESWDRDVIHRYSYIKLKGTKWVESSNRPLLPMSLDLKSTLAWGWLMQGPAHTQIAIEQSQQLMERTPPAELLKVWVETLHAHGVLASPPSSIDLSAAVGLDLPFSGALSQDGVANRTVLFGPAGGFYSACAEDIYPCCWSAIFAVEAAQKSLQERFLQDALQQYRNLWGSTLGDYLRGPHQNLRFLLPLVYRNQTMTDRLAEAILSGKSVVR